MSVPTKATSRKTLLVLMLGAALVGAVFGAALMLRGPDPHSAPALSMAPVQMKSGHILNVQTREVTVSQWQACHRAGFCSVDLSSMEKDADFPATGLSFPDVMQYVDWVNSFGGPTLRLPSAAEWREIAAEVMPETSDPIFTDPSLTWASAYLTDAKRTSRALQPSGAFSTTSAGIEDLDGNVWEWTQDCYAGSNGQGDRLDITRCPAFIMGGEHEAVVPYLVRDPARGGCAVGAPPAHLGMRLVSDPSVS